MEDDMRDLTRGPLGLEDRGELAGRVGPASPMAMNAGSQRHWCGYRSDAALVQPPFSLRRNTRAASSSIPEKGILLPLAAAQGILIWVHVRNTIPLFFGIEKLGPLPVSGR